MEPFLAYEIGRLRMDERIAQGERRRLRRSHPCVRERIAEVGVEVALRLDAEVLHRRARAAGIPVTDG